MDKKKLNVCILGAGPAGLTASYLLSKKKIPCTVLEADSKYVGGIAKTVNYKNYLIDIGGHRFFSKSTIIENLWDEILDEKILTRPRNSKIIYKKKLFSYPLKPVEILFKLGFFESILCILSYFKALVFPYKKVVTFEHWITNHFGRRLFTIFFKTYTEKVWGMKCCEISSDWAAQRIKGLSLFTAIKDALTPFSKRKKPKNQIIKTLIDSFKYPRLGPGMMWEHAASKTKKQGGTILMGQKVYYLDFNPNTKTWNVFSKDKKGKTTKITANHVISSIAIYDLFKIIQPRPESHNKSQKLKYRDFLTVAIIVKDRKNLKETWFYIHDPSVKVGRIQNYKAWSKALIPDSKNACFGLEYFCFDHDSFWKKNDEDIIAFAKKELTILGIASSDDIIDACVIRQKKAYPIYDEHYKNITQEIKKDLTKNFSNLHLIGRNGMHKYNNQDHSMMTAFLTVDNIASNTLKHDVWKVNQDAQYQEKSNNDTYTLYERHIPQKI